MIGNHQEDVKPPRACELCLKKQAVWYCASDDAFLCHVCDESVHSANHVATKHERVCLRTNEISNPPWHSGFRRKARTPRARCEKKKQQKIDDEIRKRRRREDPRVPEIGGEGMFSIPENNDDDDDDDLTSFVPEFEMGFFLSNHDGKEEETTRQFNFEDEIDAMEELYYNEATCPEQSLMICKKDYENVVTITTKREGNEDYDESNIAKQRNNTLLRLNYENVIAAWDKQGSSTSNQTDQFNFQLVPPGMIEEKRVVSSKSEREARVWRYRDKRKNRLFEKKIRYEVRKVNADKRPRMKGRFVRRSDS